jgi:hypothetical protein
MLANRTGVTRGGDLRRRCRQGSSTQGTLSGGLISVAVPWIAAQPFWSSFFRLSARAACALVRTLVHEVRLSTGRTQDKYSCPCLGRDQADRAQQWTRQACTNFGRGRFWGGATQAAHCARPHGCASTGCRRSASHGRRSAPSKARPEDVMESIGDACPECRRRARDQETTDMLRLHGMFSLDRKRPRPDMRSRSLAITAIRGGRSWQSRS